ncbi:MAG: hypothetical protein Q8O89_02175 [Nanoarchaeota archaeon]|nr:hypothetical protein [Nanoarchaeota archaeon]
MKKEEESKLKKFLDYITSKTFRDAIKNIIYTFAILAVVIAGYFAFINYGTKRVRDSTGVDVIKALETENSPAIQLSEIDAIAFISEAKLRTKIAFSANIDTRATVRFTGNGRSITLSSPYPEKNHEFFFNLTDSDYSTLFVYTVTVKDDAGREQQVMGKIRMPEKPPEKINGAKITIN